MASILATLLLSIGTMYFLLDSGDPIVISDVKEYGIFNDFKGYSNLYVFPKKMPDSAKIESYYYYQKDTVLIQLVRFTLSILYQKTILKQKYYVSLRLLKNLN